MRRAIVTGGAGLIGTAICRGLAADGWEVASFDLLQADGPARQIVCDIGDEASVAAAFETLGWDRLDLLVNNGGRSPGIGLALETTTLDQWNTGLVSYLTGAFLLCRAAVQRMERGGSIVNIASTRAFMSEGGDFAYAAAKAGLVGLTRSLAVHLGPKIRVNAIAPGWITAATDLREVDHAQHPAGRVGRPADIAEAVAYLADAGFVTGQVLTVDGGMTRKMIYAE